ncbi:MAG: response regulator [Cryobacterium sp.]|nr:response regulator [Oligoflexia bacterium]
MTPADVQILIVDDVQSMRIQVKEILRSCGFEKIRTASNGLEALGMVNELSAHLLICDWHMAPMSGLELLKEIRNKDKLRDTAFLMLTAEGTKERVIEALKSGLDDYVMKPFTVEHARLKVMGALLKRKVL